MRADNFDPEDLVQHFQGTSSGYSFDSAFGPDGILNDDFTPKYPDMTEDDMIESDYNYVDNFIFYCPTCGWWCETCEANELDSEQVCNDCYEQETENE